MDPTTSRISAPDSGLPGLRVKTMDRRVFESPSLEQLFGLVRGLGPDNHYLVIDRLDRPDGECYAQALHDGDGVWVVEYRDGGRARHFQAFASGPGVACQILAGWSLQLPGWRGSLAWRPLYQ